MDMCYIRINLYRYHYLIISMNSCSANSLTQAWHNHKGAASIVDPTLDCAPGTHYDWVERGDVDSKLVQDFVYMTDSVRIEPITPRS